MATLIQDLRHALRGAARQPGVTLVIVLTLAVGIGATTAIFTYLVESYGTRVQAPDPDRLFFVDAGTRDQPRSARISYPEALDYRAALAGVGELVPWTAIGGVLGLPGDGGTAFGLIMAIGPEYFDFFGTRFVHGRDFLPAEHRPDGARVAVIDHTFWSRHLGADPAILGRTISFNRLPLTVIGVTPSGFENPALPVQAYIYIPAVRFDEVAPRPVLADRGSRWFESLLRAHPDVPLHGLDESLEARLAVIAKNLDREHPWPDGEERHVTVRGIEESTREVETGDLMLAGAVALLLALASANVANLLLARAAGRRREIAVHAAVGASRGRIAARLLIESVLLALAGGALGLVFSRWITAAIDHFLRVMPLGYSAYLAGDEGLELDHRVLAATLLVSVLTGCLFGVAPVLHAARTDLASALRGAASNDARPGRRFGARRLLVVAQVTLATVLLLGTGLLIRGMSGLLGSDLGFETERQLLVALAPALPRAETPLARREEQRRLFEIGRQRLAELPGVESVTLTSSVPATGAGVRQTHLVLPERPGESFAVDRLEIGRDFFATFGIELVRGRELGAGDRAGGVGAVVVSQAFVERFLAGAEPLGYELRLPSLRSDTADDRFVVVGVAPDIRHASRRQAPEPLIYVSLGQVLASNQLRAVARTAGAPRLLVPRVRRALATAHPDLALVDVGTYDRQIAHDLASERTHTALAGLFSVFGLGLACLGIYSVMSFAVSSRRRELGIRMALGASSRALVRRVLGEAGVLTTAGVLLGVAAALALARLLTSLLYGVAPHDPGTFLTLPLLLAAVGLAAAWLPAWRAGRVDPTMVLREE